MPRFHLAPCLIVLIALLACKKTDGSAGSKCESDADCKNGLVCRSQKCVFKANAEPTSAATRAPTAAPTPTTVQQALPAVDQRNSVPDPWTFPETDFVPVGATCAEPFVVVTTLPETAPKDYDYYYTRYLLAAYPGAFSEMPAGTQLAPRQVAFREVNRKGQRSLVAQCGDSRTANKFVAAYRRAVRGSTPQPVCSAAVSGWNQVVRALFLSGKDPIPPAGDSQPAVQQQCARIGVCIAILRPETPGNPGVDCLRSPTRFDRHCTRKATCGEVLDCMGK